MTCRSSPEARIRGEKSPEVDWCSNECTTRLDLFAERGHTSGTGKMVATCGKRNDSEKQHEIEEIAEGKNQKRSRQKGTYGGVGVGQVMSVQF